MSAHFFAKEVSASAATIAVVLWTMIGAATTVTAQVQTVVEYGTKMKWDYGEYGCPVGTTVLYRLYWGGVGWPDHRLTTSTATFTPMLAEGWVFEGHGRTGAFACVPSYARSVQ